MICYMIFFKQVGKYLTHLFAVSASWRKAKSTFSNIGCDKKEFPSGRLEKSQNMIYQAIQMYPFEKDGLQKFDYLECQ